ncbi:MAG: bifunctional DNA primase/polymerase [Planctomycetota bacterium]|jgi:hypothetical protein|nr:bifunctional DNA primase/polymerase [Planctomycetota bacterium]
MNPIKLSEQGYFVFPTTNYQKFPTKIGRRTWDMYIAESEQTLLHAQLLHHGADRTGAALCPQSSDPVPLLILDLDTYGTDLNTCWHQLAPGEDRPAGLGIISTASGGWHLWFRLPPDIKPDRLPAQVDFGQGIGGEVRCSGNARRLIMLPGSAANNKHGKRGKYEAVGTLDLEALPEPPPSLLSRLLARRSERATEHTAQDGLPTEAVHLLRALGRIPSVPEGDRNNFVAQVGQILGRLCPSQKPSDKMLSHAWEILSAPLGEGFEQVEFLRALSSGWQTGRKNADEYGPREKHPTVSDIRAECEAIFRAVPWMVEVRDSTGKTKEFQVGFGGSAKRRNEATRVVKVKDLSEVLPTLTRLGNADPDTVVRSPLFIQPGWSRALDFMLRSEKGVDQLGIPPEERFWEMLEEWSRISAGDLNFIETWSAKRPGGPSSCLIVWPVDEPPALVIPPALHEPLLIRVGDLPTARRLVKKNLLEKSLVGMKGGKRALVCPLSTLDPSVHEWCGAQYERYIERKNQH